MAYGKFFVLGEQPTRTPKPNVWLAGLLDKHSEAFLWFDKDVCAIQDPRAVESVIRLQGLLGGRCRG